MGPKVPVLDFKKDSTITKAWILHFRSLSHPFLRTLLLVLSTMKESLFRWYEALLLTCFKINMMLLQHPVTFNNQQRNASPNISILFIRIACVAFWSTYDLSPRLISKFVYTSSIHGKVKFEWWFDLIIAILPHFPHIRFLHEWTHTFP